MPSVTALRRWLVFVALLRLFSGAQRMVERCREGGGDGSAGRHAAPACSPAVGLGYAAPHRFQTNLYAKQPEAGEAVMSNAAVVPIWGTVPLFSLSPALTSLRCAAMQ